MVLLKKENPPPPHFNPQNGDTHSLKRQNHCFSGWIILVKICFVALYRYLLTQGCTLPHTRKQPRITTMYCMNLP